MQKRLLAFSGTAFILVLLVFLLVPQGAIAEDTQVPEDSPGLSVDSVSMLHPGDQTTVSVHLKNATAGVNMLQFAMEYNAAELILVNANAGSAFATTGEPVINDQIPGIIYFNWEGEEALISDCILLDLTFEPATSNTVDSSVRVSESEECVVGNWDSEFDPILTTGMVHVEKEWIVVRSVAANFAGKIGLNYYLLLPDYVREDPGAYVLFTAPNGAEERIPVSKGILRVESEEQRYCFTYTIVAAQIQDIINIKVFDGNDNPYTIKSRKGTVDYTLSGVNYSFYDYCIDRQNNSTDAKMRALATAAIDYCTAAQIYFNHNVTNQVVLDLSRIDTVTMDQLNQFVPVQHGTLPADIGLKSITVLFDADNSFRLYFNYYNDAKPGDFSYYVDTVEAEPHLGSGAYYVGFNNVPSSELNTVHTITITDGNDTYSIDYSVISYARSIVKSGQNENSVHLGKAIYLYNIAATAYFKNS